MEVCGGWQDPDADRHVKGRFLHASALAKGKPFDAEQVALGGPPVPRLGAFEVQVAFMTPEGARGPSGADCGGRCVV